MSAISLRSTEVTLRRILSPCDGPLPEQQFPHLTSLTSPTSPTRNTASDPFDLISVMFPCHDNNAKFWWYTTGSALAQMLKRASYPIHEQYCYLVFYHLTLLREFGAMSLIASHSDDNIREPMQPRSTLDSSSDVGSCTPPLSTLKARFQSYMTDDHSPIELSWQFDREGRAGVRFAIDPVRRQLEGDPRGPMGIFEDLGRSNILAKGFNLDWCRTCADLLTLPTLRTEQDLHKASPEYPSQYFVGFDFTSLGIVMKAYFLPETRATVTSMPKSALITSCIIALSTPSPDCPNPPDLLTPWKRTLSFFSSLPTHVIPALAFIAVDCVPSYKNRLKVYARTPRATLANIRCFFTLGRDQSSVSPVAQQAVEKATTLWHLLFPALASPDCDDEEPPCPQHPTGGLVWYYELRPGYADPFPKVYFPVRHWCSSDEEVVRVMEEFYAITGNINLVGRYGQDVRETYTHRPLSTRTGIHTYISLAVKPDDVEVTSYFNPECYAPERRALLNIASDSLLSPASNISG